MNSHPFLPRSLLHTRQKVTIVMVVLIAVGILVASGVGYKYRKSRHPLYRGINQDGTAAPFSVMSFVESGRTDRSEMVSMIPNPNYLPRNGSGKTAKPCCVS